MAMSRHELQRPHLTEEENSRSPDITGSAIMAPWLGILLISAAVMTAIFFR